MALFTEIAIEAIDVAVLQGRPGCISMGRTPCDCAQAMKARFVNSGPLSALTEVGQPIYLFVVDAWELRAQQVVDAAIAGNDKEPARSLRS